MKTIDAAQGRWPGIFAHFGVDDRYLSGRHSDCPLCGDGQDRFRFADRDGTGNFFCSQCHPSGGSAFTFLKLWTGRDFKSLASEIDSIIGNIEKREAPRKVDPVKRLKKIQAGVMAMDGVTPVRRYLKQRGLRPTKAIEYHPAVPYYDNGVYAGTYPAMLCRVISPEGAPLTYHVTHLTDSGEKAPVDAVRKVLPPAADMSGAAIRLFPMAQHIGIAEGVETALAVERMFGVPCWATYSAHQLEGFIPPQGVEEVTVFADNDFTYTGQKAAFALANRLARSVRVSVRVPVEPGTDFADELLEQTA